MRMRGTWSMILAAVTLGACGGGDPGSPGGADAGYPAVTTDHCTYAPVPMTAGAGGVVTAGALTAGAAEAPLDIPVSTALGAYTARAGFLGTTGKVDLRHTAINGKFNPSIGIETRPMARAVALSAGGETVVLLDVDLGFGYEAYTFELEQRLGPAFAGKVMIVASHSHSAWGQHSGHAGIGGVGAGQIQKLVHDRFLDTYESVTRAALDARRPARIGIAVDTEFDADDRITRDRREENDALAGGPRDDNMLFLIRVDGTDDAPIAVMPIVGIHGTLMGSDNSFASTDAPGARERALEERFDSPVVVAHLQGTGGDVSPVGHGMLDCANPPGNPDDPCWQWLRAEGLGRVALPAMWTLWNAAGDHMTDHIAIEMLTRSVPLGPRPETFTIRGGALSYARFDRVSAADRRIWADDGSLLSPIDEFNAPVGAALCEKDYPIFPAGLMTGVDMLPPYGSCVTIDVAGDILGQLLGLQFDAAPDKPVCQSTRTTVSALRLGDYVIGALPGEITTLLADTVRAHSPVAPDKTILVGYAQGEMGYLLTPEDWLQGGYESSINFWGPLEGEYLAERLIDLLAMAVTPEREDAGSTGADRYVTADLSNDFAIGTPAIPPGTIPSATELGDDVWTRTGIATAAQPAATIERVAGLAQFVWIGAHPAVATPVVTLQRETSPGVFADVRRRSGRTVHDHDVLLSYSQLPLRPAADEALTHVWVAEWQAVPWTGSGGLDDLDHIAAVPLGRYRFHVNGPGYEIDSTPFEVTPAALHVTAARDGAVLAATVRVHAPKGFRLLDLIAPSNQPVPLRDHVFTVVLHLDDGTSRTRTGVTSDPDGQLRVDAGADAPAVVSLRVTDDAGNTGTTSL